MGRQGRPNGLGARQVRTKSLCVLWVVVGGLESSDGKVCGKAAPKVNPPHLLAPPSPVHTHMLKATHQPNPACFFLSSPSPPPLAPRVVSPRALGAGHSRPVTQERRVMVAEQKAAEGRRMDAHKAMQRARKGEEQRQKRRDAAQAVVHKKVARHTHAYTAESSKKERPDGERGGAITPFP